MVKPNPKPEINLAAAFNISPLKALSGEPVHIRVTGLDPDTKVKLVTKRTDNAGVKWESHAIFITDIGGSVDLNAQAPVSGTYSGIDPSGLFWSMRPVSDMKPQGAFPNVLEPQRITIYAEVGGKHILSGTMERLLISPDVKRQPVNEAGVKGTLFIPPHDEKYSAIIVLGGSEGGIYEPSAAIYASQGYVTLALAYFGLEGLPTSLVNIPLETIERGIRWLDACPQVNKDAIGIWGVSKGAELALLAASKFPKIKAVVAKSPSSVVFEGISEDMGRNHKSSWSYKGESLPFVPTMFNMRLSATFFWAKLARRPWQTRPMYEYALRNKKAVERATIEVENINGPVLLTSGGQDGVWPAGKMAAMIMERLKAKGHPFPDVHLHYEDAGHQIVAPYSPTTVNWLTLPGGFIEGLGGSPKGNAAAAMDSWHKINEFFSTHLKKRNR
jgi:dienelactone hydrolase